MTPPDVDVRYEPEHDAVGFDEAGTPFLTHGRHAEHGNGWTLWYLDGADGVESYFIPGDLTDVDAAVDSARRWLAVRADG